MVPNPVQVKLVKHAYKVGDTFATCLLIGLNVLTDVCIFLAMLQTRQDCLANAIEGRSCFT